MAKTQDVPKEIREFNKIFNELEYRYDTSSVFHDYLDYCIYVFNTGRDPEQIDQIRRRYGNDYEKLVLMFHAHVKAMDEALKSREWYDLLGVYYEIIVSRSKSSAMGQFFTPPDVCNFMAQINGADDNYGKGVTVNDCAAGSGRTLLAWHAIAPGNYLFADDLDPMCTKMCAINFIFHGAVGQVCNTNSLTLQDWRFGYAVNEHLNTRGELSLRPITAEESYSYQMFRRKVEKPEQADEPANNFEVRMDSKGQLSMF